jgi:hypothetical protein
MKMVYRKPEDHLLQIKNMKYMLYIKDQERVKSTLAIILNFE